MKVQHRREAEHPWAWTERRRGSTEADGVQDSCILGHAHKSTPQPSLLSQPFLAISSLIIQN